MPDSIVTDLRKALRDSSDEKTRQSGLRFFKESVTLYGVKSAVLSKIGKEYFNKIKKLDKKEIFALCENLFHSGYCEEQWIAASWIESVSKKFEPEDFKLFETWIDKYIANWASCDTFCNHSVGNFIQMYPEYIKELKRWAHSENLWKRRAAAVTLIVPAKQGKFLKDIFEIADILLLDKEDMVQKGYGWMLKEASRQHQKDVFNYVVEHKKVMPRTSLRYAIEKMPQFLRQEAMKK